MAVTTPPAAPNTSHTLSSTVRDLTSEYDATQNITDAMIGCTNSSTDHHLPDKPVVDYFCAKIAKNITSNFGIC